MILQLSGVRGCDRMSFAMKNTHALTITGIRRNLRFASCAEPHGLEERESSDSAFFPTNRRTNASVLSDFEYRLGREKEEMLCVIYERALEQNPELKAAVARIEAQESMLLQMRIEEQAAAYREWKRKQDEARKAARHSRYDDRRKVNVLVAIRRDCVYKSATRIEQLEMEVRRYWEPMGLDMPEELASELSTLRAERQSLAG